MNITSRMEASKPYYGTIVDSEFYTSHTGHIHAAGVCATHPNFKRIYTSRIVKIDLYDADKYAEFETRNSRYSVRMDEYDNLKFLLTSDETKDMLKDAEIDFAFLDNSK